MTDPVEHVIYKLRNAPVSRYPFPHFYAENVFPDDFYWNLLKNLPEDEKYSGDSGTGIYNNRRFAVLDALEFDEFKSNHFASSLLSIFPQDFHTRFPDGKAKFSTEWRLVRDEKGYQIGPHTDAKWKVLSLLFYLPVDNSYPDAGTSIFVPEDHKFECAGGPHYNKQGFLKAWTAPYKPNSCFGFWKTSNSWHGVDEIGYKMRRDVLLYNIFAADT